MSIIDPFKFAAPSPYLVFDSFNRADGPIGNMEVPPGQPWVPGTSWPDGVIVDNSAGTNGTNNSQSDYVIITAPWYAIEVELTHMAAQFEFWDIGLSAYSGLALNSEIELTFGPNIDPVVLLTTPADPANEVELGHTWADGDRIRMEVTSATVTILLNGLPILVSPTGDLSSPPGIYAGFNHTSDSVLRPGIFNEVFIEAL